MDDATSPSTRPKAKKNKIRPKLKPIVSASEDDDEGLGYGEWAPSPAKPRQSRDNDWSSEEDEKKDEDPIQDVSVELGKKMRPKLQPVSNEDEKTKEGSSSENKLQLSKSSSDGKKEEEPDNRASNSAVHTHCAGNSSAENMLSDESLQKLGSRIWKCLVILLCIAFSCEVLSLVVIAKVRLSHIEMPTNASEAWMSGKNVIAAMDETGAGEVSSSLNRKEDEVPRIELSVMNDEEVMPAAENVPSSEKERIAVASELDGGHYDTNAVGDSESELDGLVNELQEIEMDKLEELATEEDEQTEVEVLFSAAEVPQEGFESNDEQPMPSAKEDDESEQSDEVEELFASEVVSDDLDSYDGTTEYDISGSLLSGLVQEGFESNDEQPGAAEDEESEQLEVEVFSTEVGPDYSESSDEQPSEKEDTKSKTGVVEQESDHSKLEAVEHVLPTEIKPSQTTEQPVLDEELVETDALDLSHDERVGDESGTYELKDTRLVEVVSQDIDSSKLEAAEYVLPSDEINSCESSEQVVLNEELDETNTLDLARDEGLGDESNAYELQGTSLVEAVSQDIDISNSNEQSKQVVTDEHESESTSVEEVLASDKLSDTNIDNDGSTPSEESESADIEPPNIELDNKTEVASEDDSDIHEVNESPSSDDNDTHENNDDEYEHEPQSSPRTIKTKREFLVKLNEFEDAFESYEVIDALIGHVACVVPKLLLRRMSGIALRVKGRLSRKQ